MLCNVSGQRVLIKLIHAFLIVDYFFRYNWNLDKKFVATCKKDLDFEVGTVLNASFELLHAHKSARIKNVLVFKSFYSNQSFYSFE